jgi:hypothetical protein
MVLPPLAADPSGPDAPDEGLIVGNRLPGLLPDPLPLTPVSGSRPVTDEEPPRPVPSGESIDGAELPE